MPTQICEVVAVAIDLKLTAANLHLDVRPLQLEAHWHTAFVAYVRGDSTNSGFTRDEAICIIMPGQLWNQSREEMLHYKRKKAHIVKLHKLAYITQDVMTSAPLNEYEQHDCINIDQNAETVKSM